MNEGIVRAAFLPFGELTDINMPLDAASQKHRGFCFVQFEDKVGFVESLVPSAAAAFTSTSHTHANPLADTLAPQTRSHVLTRT